jgi:hypothetical protein
VSDDRPVLPAGLASAHVAAALEDPLAAAWSFDGEPVPALHLLDFFVPGLALHPRGPTDAPALVPRAVFHEVVALAAERLARAWRRFPDGKEHELDLLARGIVAVRLAASPPGTDDARALADLYPAGARGMLASMHPVFLFMQGPGAMTGAARFTQDALSWASKRHVRDRRCATTASGLLRQAQDAHAEVARFFGDEESAAREDEAAAQLASIASTWRARLGPPRE